MDRQKLIWNFQEEIIEIYKQENLKCLSGLYNEFKVKDKQILAWHSEVTRKCKIKYKSNFDYFKNFDDLIVCSEEIMYFTAQLFLYRPYLNNPLNRGIPFANGVVYPNYQNLEARRYNMFTDIVYEKIYNYWDRIGDLIASFFPELIEPKNVFFAKAIEIIPVEFNTNEYYSWLKSFKENEYLTLNSKRKQVVHYVSSDTEDKYKHLNSSTNRGEIESWMKKRIEIADYFKSHINLTIDGFYNTLKLLEEIDEKLFKDIE